MFVQQFAFWTHAYLKLVHSAPRVEADMRGILRTASQCASWVLFQGDRSWVPVWLHFAGRSQRKEEHHKPFISHARVGQRWASKDVNTKERKGYVIITPATLPASHSYRLSKGNDSLLNILAQLGQGSATVIPEGMPPETSANGKLQLRWPPGCILIFVKETSVESSTKQTVTLFLF